MNSKRILVVVLLCSAATASLLFRGGKRSVGLPSPTPSVDVRQLPAGPFEPRDPRWAELKKDRARDEAWEWKRPINFYGRVVSEADAPVSAARVVFEWSDLSPNGASHSETQSDSAGYFSLIGQKGRGLSVQISKAGYDTPAKQRFDFDYAQFWAENYHEPDPKRPVIFQLRTKGEGATLLVGETSALLPSDGAPVRVGLLSDGRVDPNGQIELSAMTNTERYPPRLFDWRASVSVPAGGLVIDDSEFPVLAPEDGYQATSEINMMATATNWKPTVEKAYYIRFGSPVRYGWLRVRISGFSQKVHLNYAINPSGSRNLEQRESRK